MLARLSCWKALFAAATRCVISALKVQSELKTLFKYLKCETPLGVDPHAARRYYLLSYGNGVGYSLKVMPTLPIFLTSSKTRLNNTEF